MAKRIDSLQVAAVNTSQPSTVWVQNEESQEEQQQEQVQYMHNQNSGQNEVYDKLWKHQEMTAKNQEASIKNMERQIGQLSKHFATERPSSSLPSDTIPNSKEECKAIQLRSGRTLVSNNDTTRKQVESSKKPTNAEEANDQDMVPNKNTENPKEEEAIQGQQKKEKSITPPLPYPQRLNKETKDQHFRKFLETFKKGKHKSDSILFGEKAWHREEEEGNNSIILGRPFLATARAIIDVEQGELTLRMHEESITLKVFPEQQNSEERSQVINDCFPEQTTINTVEQKDEQVVKRIFNERDKARKDIA
ncbi:uncharacterized protein LOC130981828 [Arachis stenosperma]|uniref:uncharacterized protein LOC130981828 n=1 Tax=Arachis stenosperma TaxID=217475 RepID=UPI0025AD9BC2|nr:uncharacterized protein LOC130981828 [Arachis stenosperma]